MSFYLGAALQLFGRPWDKLYHVLVTPDFESRPDFFYKPKHNRVIEWRLPDGTVKRLNTEDAEITLAELPFIRLREKLDLDGKGFHELVAEGQAELDTAIVQPDLVVSLAGRTIRIGPRLIKMVPVQFMLYLAFLRQKLEGCKRPGQPYCGNCTDCFLTLGDMVTGHNLARMGADYEAIYGGSPGKAHELLPHWKGDDGVKIIRQNRSRLNREIKEVLNDDALASRYIIDSIRRYGDTRYGVRAEKGKIKVEKKC
jgi:CRISPR-associated protein Csx14